MKLFNPANYENLAESINLKSDDIADTIRSYPLTFDRLRIQAVEWGMELPMFVPAFYGLIKQGKRIPTQSEFWNHYMSVNNAWFKNSRLDELHTRGLKARVYRTYPSLVRDVHFTKYATERLKSEEVIYNTGLDIEDGIDMIIVSKKTFYAINLYTNTQNAHVGRRMKAHRHTDFNNVKYLEVPVEFKDSIKCGEFFLYGQRELDKIKASIGANQ